MSDQQIIKWCFGISTLLWLLRRIGFATEHLAKKARHARKELPEFLFCDTPDEAQDRKEEISQFVSQYIGEKRDRLKPDLSFVKDLRVPPGELGLLIERIEERFGLKIHHKNIQTFGDLLALVKVRQPQDSSAK